MVQAITGHVPIGAYSRRFFHEPSHCMCGNPFESVAHIMHSCTMYTRHPSPAQRVHLATFVRFLKKNPRAFEWPGANLEESEGGGICGGRGGAKGAPTHPRHGTKLSIGSAGGAPPVGAQPPPPCSVGAAQFSNKHSSANTNVLFYRRVATKPRVRRDDPNQSDIHMFFFPA